MKLLFCLLPVLLLGLSACTNSEVAREETVVEERFEPVTQVEGPTVRVLANGKAIGYYLDGGQFQIGVISEKGYPFWLSLSDTYGVHGSIIRKRRPFYFRSPDCSGTPYVASGGTKYAMWDGEIIRSQDPDDAVQLYYVPRGADTQQIAFYSVRASRIIRESAAGGDISRTTSNCTAIPAAQSISAVQVFPNDLEITAVSDATEYEMPVSIDTGDK